MTMFNLFKKKEGDIHEKERLHIRESKEFMNERDLDEDDEGIGVLIQFTPIVTYLYLNKEGFNYSDDLNGYFELQDMDGNAIDVFGNIISTRIDHLYQLPDLIKRYRLEHPTIPIVQIEVKAFEG
jgi:hypothetical protein